MNVRPLLKSRYHGFARWAAGPHDASPLFTLRQKWLAMGVMALLIMGRVLRASWFGRFQDEEGPVFFAYGWHHGAWDSLWRSFAGYLNLAANGVTLLSARLVQHGVIPLEQAPRVTMAIALLVQLLPAAIVLNGNWPRATRRWSVMAMMLVCALAPACEEVWLNVLHIQYHLTLCCALFLAFDCPRRVRGWIGQALVLIMAPLCGPGAMILGPLFALRTVIDRSPGRLVQTGLLGLASLAQLVLFFTPSPVRGQFVGVGTLASILFDRLGVMPLLGMIGGNGVGDLAIIFLEKHGLVWSAAYALFCAVACVYCAFVVWTAWRHRRTPMGWMIAAGLAIAGLSFGGGMINSSYNEWFSVGAGERYNFLPLVLFEMALAGIAGLDAARGGKIAVRLCAVTLLIGLAGYPMPIRELRDGPRWHDEVALWRADHTYQPRTWPADWRIDLSRNDVQCPKPSVQAANIADPAYCETNWLARVIAKQQDNLRKAAIQAAARRSGQSVP